LQQVPYVTSLACFVSFWYLFTYFLFSFCQCSHSVKWKA
jgi:hypothetical protein